MGVPDTPTSCASDLGLAAPAWLSVHLSAARNSLFTVFSLIKIWLESAFCKQSAKRHFRNAVCCWMGPEVIPFMVGRLSTETRPWRGAQGGCGRIKR